LKYSQGADFKRGIADTLPIVAGFIPACFTFGLVGRALGLGNLEVLLMSALIFAGTSQFAGVKLLAAGTAAPLILLLTLIVNLRYLMISFSFSRSIPRGSSLLTRMWIGFSLTEEVYAVSMLSDNKEELPGQAAGEPPELPVQYLLGLQLPPYLASLFSTAAGIALAVYIPSAYLPALNTSLYALLIALIVPQLRKHRRNLIICLFSAGFSWLLQPYLGSSAVLAATLLGLCAGIFIPFHHKVAEVEA
jgi:predicted branched-subunit amino acid permease